MYAWMPFFCQQCGECCSVMGLVFAIRKDLGSSRFLLENVYTGEKTEVEVPDSTRNLFLCKEKPPHWQDPCPFLRYDEEKGRAVCTVHGTRPVTCREYRCWRVLVLDGSGRRIGRVMEPRYLHLEEEGLVPSWMAFRERMDDLSDDEWDAAAARFFRERGYSVFF